jgi:N-carbamoylputrescine amidase
MRSVRVATVVFHAPRGRSSENLDRMDAWTAAARRKRAAIVCFPELNITGYGSDAGLASAAEPVPGPATERLCAMARAHNAVILAGLAEAAGDGRLYACHLVVAPEGLIGAYRKLHTAPPEQGLFAPGEAAPVFEAAGVRFGVQLCYDAHFPELATRMALDGADVIFMPHASPRGTPSEKLTSWMRHLPARAFDNGIFIAACNQTGDNGSGLVFPGAAVVIGPDGRPLAQYKGRREGLLVAELDADALAAVRRHPMRYFLPRRRPDVYPGRRE